MDEILAEMTVYSRCCKKARSDWLLRDFHRRSCNYHTCFIFKTGEAPSRFGAVK